MAGEAINPVNNLSHHAKQELVEQARQQAQLVVRNYSALILNKLDEAITFAEVPPEHGQCSIPRFPHWTQNVFKLKDAKSTSRDQVELEKFLVANELDEQLKPDQIPKSFLSILKVDVVDNLKAGKTSFIKQIPKLVRELIDLRNIDLSMVKRWDNCDLRYINFQGARFSDNMIFDNCKFDGASFAYQNLQSATFSNCSINNVDFEAANLNKAHIWPGRKAESKNINNCNFKEANLSEADIEISNNRVNLTACNFEKANFESSNILNLYTNSCNFKNCDFKDAKTAGTHFQNSNMENCYFDGLKIKNGLSFTNCNLRYSQLTKLENPDLPFASFNTQGGTEIADPRVELNFNRCLADFIKIGSSQIIELRGQASSFYRADMSSSRFANLKLQPSQGESSQPCNLQEANLSHSRFDNCQFIQVDAPNIHLYHCNFNAENIIKDSNLIAADFGNSNLNGLDLSAVDLRFAKFADTISDGAFETNNCIIFIPESQEDDEDIRNQTGNIVMPQRVLNNILNGGGVCDRSLIECKLQRVSLRNQVLSGANFRNALMMGADLQSCDLNDVNFAGADLALANLDASLTTDSTIFIIKPKLKTLAPLKANIFGVSAIDAEYKGEKTDIEIKELSEGNVEKDSKDNKYTKCLDLTKLGAEIRRKDYGHYDFGGLYLRNRNLTGGDFRAALFTSADLTGSTLHDANLHGADFRNCDLNGTGFANASILGADFSNTAISSHVLANLCDTKQGKGFQYINFRSKQAMDRTSFYLQFIEPWEHNSERIYVNHCENHPPESTESTDTTN